MEQPRRGWELCHGLSRALRYKRIHSIGFARSHAGAAIPGGRGHDTAPRYLGLGKALPYLVKAEIQSTQEEGAGAH